MGVGANVQAAVFLIKKLVFKNRPAGLFIDIPNVRFYVID
jgi:hypothetical protein